MPLIKTIDYTEADEPLKTIYDQLIQSRGKIADVHKIQSLNPQSIVDHMDLYMTLMYGQSPLKRVIREMLGVVVSKANQCEYCQIHHIEAVNHYWKNEARATAFMANYKSVDLNEVEYKLCTFAHIHTLEPAADKTKLIDELKSLGLSDRAILDATMIIAYFNFVNRIVLALQVDLEADKGKGYKF